MAIIAWSSLALVLLVGFLVYATIKTKSTSLNAYAPYKEWIGKRVTLNKAIVLLKEKVPVVDYPDYPYVLLDSLHPQWQYVQEQKDMADVEEVAAFPAGTTLQLEKAVQFTNGVSGSSYPILFGTLNAKGNTYKIAYPWGSMDIAKRMYKVDKCWSFHQAPWQDSRDTAFYALPTADFW